MTTPALRLQLSDARALVPALSDARALVPALSVAPLPEPGVGGVMSVRGRVPMLTVSGTPPNYSAPRVATPWGALAGACDSPQVVVAGTPEVLPAEPSHYVPGALRPEDVNGETVDTLRVTDALGVVRDATVHFSAALVPGSQALDVPIGTDGVAGLYAGGAVALTASGGTAPYVWDFIANRSGGTLSAAGAYVAGPLVGIDRVRVTDALGAIGLAQLEVVPGLIGVPMDGDPVTEYFRFVHYGPQVIPYARVWGEGGEAPYVLELLDNQTGATIEAGKNLRVAVELLDAARAALDLTGWTFAATLYSQRGAVLADDLVLTAAGSLLEVDLPDPSTLALTPAILRITATTAGAVYALGYTTTAIEVLLIERPET